LVVVQIKKCQLNTVSKRGRDGTNERIVTKIERCE
jgi:hypothetical protein